MSPTRPLPGLTGPGRRARWRREVLRRVVAAGCAATAVLLVVQVLRPPPPVTVAEVVAAHDLPAGTVLAAGHLTVRHVPVAAPASVRVVDPAAVVGRRTGTALVTGESVTTTRLVPRSAADGLPTGHVAVHVLLADPGSVDLLVPTARVVVYPAEGGSPLAEDASVLALDPPPDTDPLTGVSTAERGVVLGMSGPSARAVLSGHGNPVGGPVVALAVAPASAATGSHVPAP